MNWVPLKTLARSIMRSILCRLTASIRGHFYPLSEREKAYCPHAFYMYSTACTTVELIVLEKYSTRTITCLYQGRISVTTQVRPSSYCVRAAVKLHDGGRQATPWQRPSSYCMTRPSSYYMTAAVKLQHLEGLPLLQYSLHNYCMRAACKRFSNWSPLMESSCICERSSSIFSSIFSLGPPVPVCRAYLLS